MYPSLTLIESRQKWSVFEKHLLSFPPRITDRLFAFLPTATILTLAKVSCSTRVVCNAYLARVWSFYRFFRRWFKDAHTFRKALRRSNAVVSGSQVIQLLDRVRYRGSDLDIYVRPGGFEVLKTFLIQEGYHPSIDHLSDYDSPTGGNLALKSIRGQASATTSIIGVYTFVKIYLHIKKPRSRRVIQLIVTNGDPIQHIVLSFHSSMLLNGKFPTYADYQLQP